MARLQVTAATGAVLKTTTLPPPPILAFVGMRDAEAQANALAIRARAEMRLAEEYDAAQERGEVHRHGGQVPMDVADPNIPSGSDLGIRRDEIHEARKMRDAEAQDRFRAL